MPNYGFNITPDTVDVNNTGVGVMTNAPAGINFTFSFSSLGNTGQLTENGGALTVDGVSFRSTNTYTVTIGGTTVFTTGGDPFTTVSAVAFPTIWTLAISLTGGRYFQSFSLTGFSGGLTAMALLTTGGGYVYNSTGSGIYDNTYTSITAGSDMLNTNIAVNVVSFYLSGVENLGMVQGLNSNGIQCFGAGTRIDTVDGPVPVEDLKAGDVLRTADGGQTRVRWLGVQTMDPGHGSAGAESPVRIEAGAFGDGVPERSLRLSPDHAVALDGVLATAGALANGATIRREPQTEPFTYYHVETEGGHELILAEGVAAETYLPTAVGRFDNEDGRIPRIIPAMRLSRVTSNRLLPRGLRERLRRVAKAA